MAAASWHAFPLVQQLHVPVAPNNQNNYLGLSVERTTPVDVIVQTYLLGVINGRGLR